MYEKPYVFFTFSLKFIKFRSILLKKPWVFTIKLVLLKKSKHFASALRKSKKKVSILAESGDTHDKSDPQNTGVNSEN